MTLNLEMHAFFWVQVRQWAVYCPAESATVRTVLADIIASEFLSADYHGYALDQVAELAISQTNLYRLQNFIADFFIRFDPTESHKTLASFRWHGIATTNYDLVLERAYQKADLSATSLEADLSQR